MNEILRQSLVQLLAQAPVILVYVVGFILSIVMRRRAPVACTLAMSGFLLLLVIALVHPFLVQYIIHSRTGSSSVQLGNLFTVISIVTGALHAIGIGLLTAGIFMQRREVEPRIA